VKKGIIFRDCKMIEKLIIMKRGGRIVCKRRDRKSEKKRIKDDSILNR
jgi:hypothetical protein